MKDILTVISEGFFIVVNLFEMDSHELMIYMHLAGYIYATLLGHCLINRTVLTMYLSIVPKYKPPYQWQYAAVGIIERTLYISSLLMEHEEFIGFWILLKVAVPYIGWTGKETIPGRSKQFRQKMHYSEDPRSIFMTAIIGNGLSIIYAVMGYKIIKWSPDEPFSFFIIFLPTILILLTILLAIYVKKKEDKKPQPFNTLFKLLRIN